MPYFHHFLSESMVNNKCYTVAAANQHRPNNNGMIKQLKSGYLLHYKKRLFGKAWREVFVVLYEDSSVIWFRDRDRLDPEGGIFLRDAPEMLAAGQWVSRVPSKPEFPEGCDHFTSIAMGSRHREKVNWFLCKSERELIDWMSAINKTLPPPPPPPEELRDSRRNLAKLSEPSTGSPGMMATDSPPSFATAVAVSKNSSSSSSGASAQQLAHRMEMLSLQQQSQVGPQSHQSRRSHASSDFSNGVRSYSAGRLTSCSVRRDVASAPKLHAPIARQMSFQETRAGSSSSTPSMRHSAHVSSNDVAAGVMVCGLLPLWNPGADCWDWGMGWGWSGWNSGVCGTCALEQAALAGHWGSSAPPSAADIDAVLAADAQANDDNAAAAMFFFDDDHEIGELGDCDFGDFGAF